MLIQGKKSLSGNNYNKLTDFFFFLTEQTFFRYNLTLISHGSYAFLIDIIVQLN